MAGIVELQDAAAEGEADLAIFKTDSLDPVIAGDTLTYTLTITNSGDLDASDVTVTDTLPLSVTFGSATPSAGGSCNEASGEITCTFGSLANATSAQVLVTVTVDPAVPHGTVLTNRAGVTAVTTDTITSNNFVTEGTTVNREADLKVAKSVDDPTPNEGDTIRYTIVVTNNGPHAATTVVLTDTLPTGVTYDSNSPSQGTYNSTTGRWAVGPISNGGNATLTIDATVDLGTGGTTITNDTDGLSADQADPTPGNNQDSAAFTVQSADLDVDKSVDDPTPNEGDTVQYTIVVTNNGSHAATTVVLTDTLPTGVTYDSNSPSQGSYNSTTGRWDVGPIPNGGNATLTIDATVDPGTGGTTITNDTDGLSADQADPTPGNNQDSAAITVQSADLDVDKSVDDPAPNEGDTIQYTIIVSNNGPHAATTVVLTDTLPTGVTYVSDSPSQGPYNSTTGRWDVGSLSNGGSATLTIDATVDAGTGDTTITNLTDGLSADQADPTPGNNQDSAAITVQSADLDVDKSVDDPTPNEGDTIQYTIVVTNNGPHAATTVVLTDTLPTGVTYDSDSPSQGSYNSTTGRWAVGPIPNGGNATLTIDATVDAGTGSSTITNLTDGLSADQVDQIPGNNQDSAAFTVKSTDLQINKSDSSDPVIAGTSLAYTLTVTNDGPDDATGVTVTDTLPSGIILVSDSPSQGGYDSDTGVWTVGALSNSEGATLTLLFTVDSSTTGVLSNQVDVSGNEADPNDADNTATETTVVNAVADLEITKSAPATVEAGEQLTYTLAFTNSGPSDATGVVITDTLDSNVDYVSASPMPTGFSNDDPYWSLSPLKPGDSGQITLRVQAHRPLPNNTLLNNTAWLDADQIAPIPATAQTTVQSRPVLTITKIDNTDPITAGHGLVYTIVITNSGNEDATSVTVVEDYDPNVQFLAASPPPDTGTTDREWTFDTLPVDTRQEILIFTLVDSPLPPGTILTNQATLDSDQTAPITATQTTSVTTVSELTIFKAAGSNPVKAGAQLVYLISYSNSGEAPAYDVVITETYDSNVYFVSADPAPDYGTQNVWHISPDPLPVDAVGFILVTVGVDTPLPNGTTLTNLVTIDSRYAPSRTYTETTTVSSSTDLAFSVTDQPDPAEPGDTLTYTLQYTNTGNASATGVVVTATLDSNVSFSSATPSESWGGDDVWVWEIGEISGEGGQGEIVILADVTLPLTNGIQLDFAAQLSDDEGDLLPVTAQTTISSSVILSLSKSDGVSAVYAGDRLTYTLAYGNSGTENAYNVTITDTLPSYVDYVSCSIPGGSCQRVSADTVVFQIPVVVAKTNAQAQLVVRVQDPLPAGALYAINNARMTAPSLATPIDVQDTDHILTKPDLHVEVDYAPPLYSPGKLMTYTINYGNLGQHMHTADVIITTILPTDTVYVGHGWESSDGQTYTYEAGNLLAGSTGHTVQFTVRHVDQPQVGAPQYETPFSIAESGGGVGDAYPADNTDIATIGVPDLVVSSFTVEPLDPDPLPPGVPVTFTIVVKNQGTGWAYNPDNTGGFYVDVFTDSVPSYPWQRNSDIDVFAVSDKLAPGAQTTVVLTHPGFSEEQIRAQIKAFYVKVDNYAEPVEDEFGRIDHWTRLYGIVPEYDEMNNLAGPVYLGLQHTYLPIVLKNAR
jgi:uncharacterized repeat protein (TIGR01451 family)